jgi:hypothetical protein
VVGTLISEGVLWYRVSAGAVPVAQEHILDVGPSYVVIGGLVAGILFGGSTQDITQPTRRLRLAAGSAHDSAVDATRRRIGRVLGHSGRVACAIAFVVIAPDCFNGLAQLDVTATGHACAAATAIGVGWLLRRRPAEAQLAKGEPVHR